jgi:hypothetical protein
MDIFRIIDFIGDNPISPKIINPSAKIEPKDFYDANTMVSAAEPMGVRKERTCEFLFG